MTRTSLAANNCSLARTADVIGDKWALMILRDAFYGVRSFSAFQSGLGVAKTVLSDRLHRLTEAGILQKVRARDGIERFEYRLTAAGHELFPLIIGLVQWGDRWRFGAGREPLAIIERATGAPVQRVVVQASDGHALAPHEIDLAPGPGAAPETLAMFARLAGTG